MDFSCVYFTISAVFHGKVANLPLNPSKIHSKTKNDQTAPPVSGGQSGREFS